MPAVRTYIVSQTREVTVRANNPTTAIYLASSEFNNENILLESVEGSLTSEIRETEIAAREEY